MKDLKPLPSSNVVRIAPTQGQREWRQGTVRKEVGTHLYEVETNSGQRLRHNHCYLRKTSENKQASDAESNDKYNAI